MEVVIEDTLVPLIVDWVASVYIKLTNLWLIYPKRDVDRDWSILFET